MSDLEYITDEPPNAAVPLGALDGSPLPQDRAYQRNSFPIPESVPRGRGPDAGFADVDLSTTPLSELDQVEMEMVLECAGNGRSLMRPPVTGLEWGLGARPPVRIGGYGSSTRWGWCPTASWTWSSPGRTKARSGRRVTSTISSRFPSNACRTGRLCWSLRWGDAPLGIEHGGPIRFVMPGHYAMRSVKWLAAIEGVMEPFAGHFVQAVPIPRR